LLSDCEKFGILLEPIKRVMQVDYELIATDEMFFCVDHDWRHGSVVRMSVSD